MMVPVKLALALAVVVVVFVLNTVSVKRFHSIAGPFRIDFKRFERCSQEASGRHAAQYFIKVRKRHHESTLYSGNFSVPITMDDTLVGYGNLSSWSNNGGWKPNAYQGTFRTPFTLVLKHFKPHYEFISQFFFGETLYNPFQPGFYRFNNVTLPEHLLRSAPSYLKQFIYGRWRAELRGYTTDGEMFGCIRGYGDTLPVPI